jgi:hypothetical protein
MELERTTTGSPLPWRTLTLVMCTPDDAPVCETVLVEVRVTP